MPAVAHKQDYISVEEYYAIEETAEERSDYYDGEMFNMAGGTTEHARISANLIGSLFNALRGKDCAVSSTDQRVKSLESGLRIYPDASVFCEPLKYDDEDRQKHTATNPAALFEVLSDSTEAYDRGFKFECFRKTPSLQSYVLISQDRPHVEVFFRGDNDRWQLAEATGLAESIEVPGLSVTLELATLYERIDFAESPYGSEPDLRNSN